MTYRMAGIDVHKRMLAVVIADISVEGEYEFTHRRVGTSPRELRELAAWLGAEAVEEVVMESTAQYWRPVWEVLERDWLPQRRGAGRGESSGGPAAPGASPVEQGPSGAQARLSRRRTVGEAVGSAGADAELCGRTPRSGCGGR